MEQRRLANTRTLAARYENNTEFATALGLTKSGISQLIGGNPVRPISERAARRWEKRLGLPAGTLDQVPQQPSPAVDAPLPSLYAPSPAPDAASTVVLDTVMNELDRGIARTSARLSHEKYRGCVTYLYRLAMRTGGKVDAAEVDSLLRLIGLP